MNKLRIGVVTAIFVLAGLLQPAAADVRVGYIFSDGQMPVTVQAYRALLEQYPDLADELKLIILSESTFEEVVPEDMLSVDVLVYDVMNEQMLARFNTAHEADLISQVNSRGRVIGVGQGLMSEEQYAALGVYWDQKARDFWAASGLENHIGLARLALREAGRTDITIPEPQPALMGGYYYSTPGGGRVFGTWAEFDAWRRAHGKAEPPGTSRIAVGFYRANYYGNEMAIVDAMIRRIEASGAVAIPFFGYPGHAAMANYLVDEDGAARADVMLSFLFRFAQPDMSGTLSDIDIPVLNMITLYGRTEADWRASDSGLSLFEGTFQVAAPELAGLIAPTVVGSRERAIAPETGLSVVLQEPIDSRVERAVDRALKLAALGTKANDEKKLAILFYNYPAGAAAVGASYLNVPASLAKVLNRLLEQGYDLGSESEFTEESVLAALTEHALNIAGYAPGERDELAQQGNPVRVARERYKTWLEDLHPDLKAKINEDWGRVDNATLMIDSERDSILIPALEFGNVALLPQPARGWGEDNEQLYHADDLAPHHQYAATYLWLAREFNADAVVHVGTHGTLEWLDGKDTGLTNADSPEALIGDLPHIYPYNVDVVGEGLIARRRSAATLIDHMVPPFVKGGVYAELAELSERVSSYHQNLSKNPRLAAEYASDIRRLIEELGIADDLGINLVEPGKEKVLDEIESHDTHEGTSEEGGHYHDARHSTQPVGISHDVIHTLEDYMSEMKAQNIPFGLHALGRLPEPAHRASTVDAIVSIDRGLIGNAAETMAADMEERIVASAQLELDRLVNALSGGYTPGGTGGEPIRNPDAYPTGKNFFGIDPDKVPTRAAWRLGVELAQNLVRDHQRKHGEFPKKISFVIWGDETMRHEGIVESQIFWLLGTRPVWDARDKVVDVEVIPYEELNRPRVDIVIASAAEGMFHNVTVLMDKAVQLVKMLDDPDNHVRANYLDVKRDLIAFGYDPELADRHAGVRIFDEAPGTYNLNVSRIVEASGTWDSDVSFAHDYTKKMGHGFGNGFWGEPMEDVFRLNLKGTQTIVHSSSTMLYGGLDNDDFYMYMGGLANAVKNLDGSTPDMTVTNTRNPSRPDMTGVEEFLGTEMRTRYFNPNWIEGMQTEGYAGAGEMRAFVEYLWGWDATATDTVDDRDWMMTYSTYVQDKHDMGLQVFFDEHSPFAFQDMTARMLETTRKEYWDAPDEIRQDLARQFLDSVQRNGMRCSGITCGNPRLLEYLLEQARAAGIDELRLEEFEQDVERRMQADIQQRAAEEEQFARENEARIRHRNALLEDGLDPDVFDEYEVTPPPAAEVADEKPVEDEGMLMPLLLALGFLLILVAIIVARGRA